MGAVAGGEDADRPYRGELEQTIGILHRTMEFCLLARITAARCKASDSLDSCNLFRSVGKESGSPRSIPMTMCAVSLPSLGGLERRSTGLLVSHSTWLAQRELDGTLTNANTFQPQHFGLSCSAYIISSVYTSTVSISVDEHGGLLQKNVGRVYGL